MASIKKEYNSMGLPMNINRSNPIPVDCTELWYSLEEAQNYALNDPRSYVGQSIKVIDESTNSVMCYVIGINGSLMAQGGANANPDGIGGAIIVDETLSTSGAAADAKAVGDALDAKQPKGDYATESFVNIKIAEAQLNEGNVNLSDYALKADVPTKTSDLLNDSGYLTSYIETDPTVSAWAKEPTKPTYTAEEVGADAKGTAINTVSEHDSNENSHSDIRGLISGVKTRLDEFDNISAGSDTQPVYFSNGKPIATTYTLGASVPSDAKFTDTIYEVATTSTAGLMSAKDKTKLDSLGTSTGSGVELDTDLSTEGMAADAKAVGDAISNLVTDIGNKVPVTRTINGKALSSDITLTVEDIGVEIETDATLKVSGKAADAKATGDAITNLNTLIGHKSVSDQITDAIEDIVVEVYVQNDMPEDAPDGSIWVDLDSDGAPTTSGKTKANVYVVDARTSDVSTVDFSKFSIGDVVVVTVS